MIALALNKEATEYLALRKEAQKGSMEAQRVLDALMETLNHFKVQKNRPIAAENLLKLSRIPRNEWDMNDERVRALSTLADYLDKLLA